MSKPPYRTALITGASSGLGRALCVWFARRGVRVYAAARREALLASIAAEESLDPQLIRPVSLDVCDTDAVFRTVEDLDADSGGLDLVIANAGVSFPNHAKRFRWKNVKQIIDVNVMGATATLCAAIPKMVERDRGHIVGVSSISQYRGLPGHGAYCASKAFLSTFLESTRVDLHNSHVSVTCIEPGFIRTPIIEGAKFPLPGLLDLEPATQMMGNAILARKKLYTFPPKVAVVVKFLRVVPNFLYDPMAARIFKK